MASTASAPTRPEQAGHRRDAHVSAAGVQTPAARPRGSRARPRSARELVLRHAARLFREKGYSATSVRDIARRSRIEASALYYHFASKEALLEEVLDRSILNVATEVRQALDALPPGTQPRERFHVAIATHLRAIVQHGDFALASRRVIGEIPAGLRRKHDALRASYGSYWQELFEQAAMAGEVRSTARLGLARMFLLGALNWSSEWFDPKRKSPEELAEVFCDFLFDGLGQVPAGGLQ